MTPSIPGLPTALRGISRNFNGARRTTTTTLEQSLQSLRLSPSLARGRRCLSTEPTGNNNINVLEEFEDIDTEFSPSSSGPITAAPEFKVFRIAEHARAVPVSPSYFSRTPQFNDRFVHLEKLAKTYANLPVIPAADAERVTWMTLEDVRASLDERVKATEYARCLGTIKRLHLIHPQLKPAAVAEALEPFKRRVQAIVNVANPIPIDKFGRALGVGRRKSSTARAFVVEGDGQVLINGKTLADYFGRVHDRESAVWALHATARMDKYNVWARVEGGGTTGQAEALTLAIGKALMAHEPALKPALRRAGCVTRDWRRVERKKHGRVKARKGQTWVKR